MPVEFALHLTKHLPPDKQETGRSVHDLQQATADAKADLPSFRQELAGQLPPAFFGGEPGDDGQLMTPQSFDIVWVEADV